jgi:Tfp pilus assembly protein PilF
MTARIVGTAALAYALSLSLAPAQVEAQLGKVHFATSCDEVAQQRFDRALRYQHSFWYRESKAIFEEVLKADPQCAIAYWGIAQSLLANPFNPTPPKNLVEGLAAVEKGLELGTGTPREKALIAAIRAYYADFEKLDQRKRLQAYLSAMEEVAARFPDDDEVQIYYALALDVAASPSDKTYANQLKAAAILERIWKKQPQHPGVAHYLIHTYDYPSIAAKGLEAAQRYADIAEAAPHAQHMPSHIFTRVGRWTESIASNRKAAELAKAGKEGDDQLHAFDYLVYALLQLGRDEEATAILEQAKTVTGYNPERNTAPFSLAAGPARYMIERGDWSGAAKLEPHPSRFPYIDAITHFARALGAARSGNPQNAAEDIAKLAELRDKLRDKDAYWSEQVNIQWQTASAWTLHAQGRHDEALALMHATAEAEDRTEKGTVTPGPLAPARELYGAMLLERHDAAEALRAFEATLSKEPNRLGATLGVAKAAERLGDIAKAAQYYAKLVSMTKDAHPLRPDIVAARRFVAEH